MVLLTLLSIVQALALEFLWDHMRNRTELFEWSLAVVPGWLQMAATLNIIVLIWLIYAGMLMRFRWTPSLGDSVFPFLVGLIQFLMIDIMGDRYFALWITILGLAFGVMILVNHNAMRRARKDAANIEFFSQYKSATVADFVPQIIVISVLLIFGAAIAVFSNVQWLRVLALAVAFIVLALETNNARRYWSESMGEDTQN